MFVEKVSKKCIVKTYMYKTYKITVFLHQNSQQVKFTHGCFSIVCIPVCDFS